MKHHYLDMILSIERLHRRFLDVVKAELDRLKIEDVNNVQTLILYNIGDEELTVGELTNRGYYLGSNVSYNVKKLVDNEYLMQERAPHDKRSVKIKLSPKGLDLCRKIDSMYEKHTASLQGQNLPSQEMETVTNMLVRLEQFWSQHISHGYKPNG
jgi:DNA-binding MarR family transcriptional regulator